MPFHCCSAGEEVERACCPRLGGTVLGEEPARSYRFLQKHTTHTGKRRWSRDTRQTTNQCTLAPGHLRLASRPHREAHWKHLQRLYNTHRSRQNTAERAAQAGHGNRKHSKHIPQRRRELLDSQSVLRTTNDCKSNDTGRGSKQEDGRTQGGHPCVQHQGPREEQSAERDRQREEDEASICQFRVPRINYKCQFPQ